MGWSATRLPEVLLKRFIMEKLAWRVSLSLPSSRERFWSSKGWPRRAGSVMLRCKPRGRVVLVAKVAMPDPSKVRSYRQHGIKRASMLRMNIGWTCRNRRMGSRRARELKEGVDACFRGIFKNKEGENAVAGCRRDKSRKHRAREGERIRMGDGEGER